MTEIPGYDARLAAEADRYWDSMFTSAPPPEPDEETIFENMLDACGITEYDADEKHNANLRRAMDLLYMEGKR